MTIEEATKKMQFIQKNMYIDLQNLCNANNIPFFVSGGTAIGALRHHGFIPWDDDIDVCFLRKDYTKVLNLISTELSDKYDLYFIDNTDGYVIPIAKMCKKNTKIIEDADTDSAFSTGIFLDLFVYDRTSSDINKRKKQIRNTWIWARCCVLSYYKHPRFPASLKGIKLKAARFACLLIHFLFKLLRLDRMFFYKKYLKAAMRYDQSDSKLYTDFSYFNPECLVTSEDTIFPLVQMPFEDIQVQMLHNADKYLTSQYGDYMQIPPVEKRKTHTPRFVDFGDNTYFQKED